VESRFCKICKIREHSDNDACTSGTTLLLELAFRIMVAVPRLTRLTFLTRCSNSDVEEFILSSSSSSLSVSGSTSMVTGPRTPDEAVETALEGTDVELRTSSEPGVPGMAGILGSTLKNGIGSI
jgi:hypothetical protein